MVSSFGVVRVGVILRQVGRRQPRRRRSRPSARFEQRRDARPRASARAGVDSRGRDVERAPLPVGVPRPVERVAARTGPSTVRVVDEVDVRQVPARVADGDPLEVPVARGHLEAPALDADRPVASALGATSPRRRRPAAARRCRGSAVRRRGRRESASAARSPISECVLAVVLELDPRLRRLVEQRAASASAHALEHRQQPALHLAPEVLLLAVLVRAVRAASSRAGCRAARAPASSRRRPSARRCRSSARGAARASGWPARARARGSPRSRRGTTAGGRRARERSSSTPKQERRHPLARGRQHLARAVVEVEVPQPVDVLGLVAAHLALLEARSACSAPSVSLARQAAALRRGRSPSCSGAPSSTTGAAPSFESRPSPRARPGCRSGAGSSSSCARAYCAAQRRLSFSSPMALLAAGPCGLRLRSTPTGSAPAFFAW